MIEIGSTHLRKIEIDPVSGQLCLEYSEGDQGGTELLYCFRIPRSLVPSRERPAPTLEVGYRHETTREVSTVEWQSLPERLRADARKWLAEQSRLAQQAGKMELRNLLKEFQIALIESAT